MAEKRESARHRSGRFAAAMRNGLIGLGIGLLVGIVGTVFVTTRADADADAPTPSVVFDRIVSKDELVCASQTYNITDKSTQDPARFFDLFDIPFTDTSFWYRYVGTIKVGVDLETATLSQEDRTLKVALDPPFIISNTPDMDASGVLEEHDNLFAHVSGGDVDNFQRECIRVSEENAAQGGLMDQARSNAETNLNNLFQAALGDDYRVVVEWRQGA